MSLNTFKQRRNLYNSTFMKWRIEQRLLTLQRNCIEAALHVHNFGDDSSDANFEKLCEHTSDIETMIEVLELTFPALRHKMELIRKRKLITLQKTTVLNEEAKKLEDKAKYC